MEDLAIARRRFLRQMASLATSGFWLSGHSAIERAAAAEEAKSAADLVAGKDRRLIVQSASPVEIETPLALLAEYKVTPAPLLFVRNNQSLPGSDTLRPMSDENWSVEIAGLVEPPAKISVRELAGLEQVEHELVLQCSGNGRAVMSKISPAKGCSGNAARWATCDFAACPSRSFLII